jgi:hypothetical protein
VIEQVLMAANLNQHVRKRQAFGAPEWSEEELAESLESLRTRTTPLPDISLYEKAYDDAPWPLSPDALSADEEGVAGGREPRRRN